MYLANYTDAPVQYLKGSKRMLAVPGEVIELSAEELSRSSATAYFLTTSTCDAYLKYIGKSRVEVAVSDTVKIGNTNTEPVDTGTVVDTGAVDAEPVVDPDTVDIDPTEPVDAVEKVDLVTTEPSASVEVEKVDVETEQVTEVEVVETEIAEQVAVKAPASKSKSNGSKKNSVK